MLLDRERKPDATNVSLPEGRVRAANDALWPVATNVSVKRFALSTRQQPRRDRIAENQDCDAQHQRHIGKVEDTCAYWPHTNVEKVGNVSTLGHAIDQVREATAGNWAAPTTCAEPRRRERNAQNAVPITSTAPPKVNKTRRLLLDSASPKLRKAPGFSARWSRTTSLKSEMGAPGARKSRATDFVNWSQPTQPKIVNRITPARTLVFIMCF